MPMAEPDRPWIPGANFRDALSADQVCTSFGASVTSEGRAAALARGSAVVYRTEGVRNCAYQAAR
jgi:hypothetical protein